MEILFTLVAIALLLLALLFTLLEIYVTIIGDLKGAPFVPSNRKKVNIMLELADLKSGEKVIDLGSGNGKILIEAAQKGCRAIGVEINPFLVLFSRIRNRLFKLNHLIKIEKKDLRCYPLTDFDAVFIYLLPKTMSKIKKKLEIELKPGARIISNAFPFPDWEPVQQKDRVFLYIVEKK